MGGALVAAILAHYGYQAGLAQQPEAVVQGIRLTVSVLLLLPFLLAVALLVFYRIDKRTETRIEQDLHLRSPFRRRLREPQDDDHDRPLCREDGQASEARLAQLTAHAISQPLVTHIYNADPSAHVFEGALYIYPSHDIDGGQHSTTKVATSACRITCAEDGYARRHGRRLRHGVACARRALGPETDVGPRCRLP